MRIAWCSHYNMTEDQENDLESKFGKEVKIIKKNITWQGTKNKIEDHIANEKIWNELEKEYDIVTGIFPPVAMECRNFGYKSIYMPVSVQEAKVREDGSKQIVFKHVRFAVI